MIVKFKKLSPLAVIPRYSKPGDAGMDLTATSKISNTTFQCTYGIGISVEIPEGYVGLVFPRSSIRNTELILSNSVGVIDSGYRGEIKVGLINTTDKPFILEAYSKIAQLIILPCDIKAMKIIGKPLNNTSRGINGFGSTGK